MGEVLCSGDHFCATMAPTPEARDRQGDFAERFGSDLRASACLTGTGRGHEPAGDGDDEELLAVDQRLDVEAALDGMDDVPHALDEKQPPCIPVCPVRLEASYLVERGPDIGRDPIWLDFI